MTLPKNRDWHQRKALRAAAYAARSTHSAIRLFEGNWKHGGHQLDGAPDDIVSKGHAFVLRLASATESIQPVLQDVDRWVQSREHELRGLRSQLVIRDGKQDPCGRHDFACIERVEGAYRLAQMSLRRFADTRKSPEA